MVAFFNKLLIDSHFADDSSAMEDKQEFFYDALFGYIPIMMKKEGENDTKGEKEEQKLYTYDPVYGFVPDDETGKPDQRKAMRFNPFSSNYNPYGATYNPFRSSYNPSRLISNPYIASYIPYNRNNPYYDIGISQVKTLNLKSLVMLEL